LIKIGGKKQIPCLVIEGKALYESDDIIAYLGDLRFDDEALQAEEVC
ncbi:MAG: glutathione S-transferase N-terminal domain-containing protein, partial [Coriobacteriaceae bacterium]|nr:glutathione S-transferase N-terminal domain-containing protein [Coriobacteriaceae bacterium]